MIALNEKPTLHNTPSTYPVNQQAPAQKVFHLLLDTEFTSLGENGKQPQLLSVGICNLQTGAEGYWEVDNWNPNIVSRFTQENVIPLMWKGPYRHGFKKMAQSIKQWIENQGGTCLLALDSPWDWAWFKSLCAEKQTLDPKLEDTENFKWWPLNLQREWLVLNFEVLPVELKQIAQIEKSKHLQEFVAHHALLDARGNKKIVQRLCQEVGVDLQDTEQIAKIFEQQVYVSLQASIMGIKR